MMRSRSAPTSQRPAAVIDLPVEESPPRSHLERDIMKSG